MATDQATADERLTLHPSSIVTAADDLYLSRRGDSVLVVEPESASWCVLRDAEWSVFSRMQGSRAAAEDGLWTNLHAIRPNPAPAESIAYADHLSRAEFDGLLQMLYRRNMVSIDGATYFETNRLWPVQQYPHYYNIHMTEACNLACTYCRVYSPRHAPMMSPETCRLIVRRLLEEVPSSNALIGFHGGEPMLNFPAIKAGAIEARETGERLKSSGRGKPVTLLMQTNGTFLSPKTVGQLKELEINVGVSLDGPPKIHDESRVYHSGKGSSFHVQRGLKAAADGKMHVGYIAVIHDPSTYVEVLDHLVRECGARSVRINYSAREGRAKDTLDFPVDRAEHFAREWLRMVDYAERHHRETGVWLDISDLNLFILHLLSKQRPHMCYRSPCGIGNSILGFGHDGAIYLCDEVVGNDLFRIGHIEDGGNLRDMLDNSPVKRSMMNLRKVENLSKCSTCSWKRFHGGGCTSKTFAYFGTVAKDDPMCRFYHIVFEELMWRLWEKPELAGLGGQYGPAFGLVEAVQAMRM
jgi:uncharacterized protein